MPLGWVWKGGSCGRMGKVSRYSMWSRRRTENSGGPHLSTERPKLWPKIYNNKFKLFTTATHSSARTKILIQESVIFLNLHIFRICMPEVGIPDKILLIWPDFKIVSDLGKSRSPSVAYRIVNQFKLVKTSMWIQALRLKKSVTTFGSRKNTNLNNKTNPIQASRYCVSWLAATPPWLTGTEILCVISNTTLRFSN